MPSRLKCSEKYLKKFRKAERKLNKNTELTREIIKQFHLSETGNNFGRIGQAIKVNGWECVRQCLLVAQRAGKGEKYFWGCVNNSKTSLKEV